MEKIARLHFGTPIWIYTISRTLERASYYGIRALLVLYMIDKTINMPQQQALAIYGWLAFSVIVSQVLGAILGDLVLGNKTALITGGALHALGAFSLCIPSVWGLYAGIALIVLGSGFYTPNLISHYGKHYRPKPQLLDAVFTILYTGVFIGSAVGMALISYLGNINYAYGFALAGGLMLFSVAVPVLIPEKKTTGKDIPGTSPGKSVLYIVMAFIFIGLFWGVYEMAHIYLFDIQLKISQNTALSLPQSLWSSLGAVFTIPISIAAAILWSLFYTHQFVKLTAGFLVATLSFIVLLLIPESPSDQHIFLYILTFLLWSIAEVLISPVVYSVLTRYANPRYLAIIVSTSFILPGIFMFLTNRFSDSYREVPLLVSISGGILTFVAAVFTFLVFFLAVKNNRE